MDFNPFDWAPQPSLGPFTDLFSGWVGVLVAAVWAGALIFCAAMLIVAIAGLSKARRHHRVDSEIQATSIIWPAISIIVLVAVPAIWVILTSHQ